MARLFVGVDAHVLLVVPGTERTASCDLPDKLAELCRVERVAEGLKRGEELELGFVEVVERGEITSLENLYGMCLARE